MTPLSAPPKTSRRRLSVATFGLLGATLFLASCSSSLDGTNTYRKSEEMATLFGLFRTEIAPADAPYDRDDLVENFERVIFDQEDQKIAINPELADYTYALTKWTGPIRYRFRGDGVRPEDKAAMEALVGRLSAATGLSFVESNSGGVNYTINIQTPEERSAWWDALDTDERKRLEQTAVKVWIRMHGVPCFVSYRTADRAGSPGVITGASVYIKAELEGVFRTACLHEEVTQSLGTHNDHDEVRPSIFNDDGEFAFLTTHDADLLEILYDDRLKPGMSRAEAMPIVREVVAEIEIGE